MAEGTAAFDDPRGLRVHLVGAKGTGMTALAEILAARGAILSGSDVPDTFYTDAILASLGVRLGSGFDAAQLPSDAALVVHSAAYPRESNPQLLEAARRGLPLLSYPEALGRLSLLSDSSGIAGVHGKTTTTAIAGSLALALGLPATTLAGSAVAGFGNRSTSIHGDRYFIAETCEYRRNFLSFRPRRIVLTSIEPDHQDFYPTFDDIFSAFLDYLRLLPRGGQLIYCAEDEGAALAARRIAAERPDLAFSPYGTGAEGAFSLLSYEASGGEARFRLSGFDRDFKLRVPGRHIALDAAAALALAFSIWRDYKGSEAGGGELDAAAAAIAGFSGSKRRSEILGEADGVLFMDDYGHHPTAIRETIKGIKAFWPERRLVVDFMSHTYSRTKALFSEFVASLDGADAAVLHGIYASARELPDPEVSGRGLFEALRARDAAASRTRPLLYFEGVLEGVDGLESFLKPGDLFLTMGAGDNFRLGRELLDRRSARGGSR
jgi:UDP-N-acetylmuramate--alanine ligase